MVNKQDLYSAKALIFTTTTKFNLKYSRQITIQIQMKQPQHHTFKTNSNDIFTCKTKPPISNSVLSTLIPPVPTLLSTILLIISYFVQTRRSTLCHNDTPFEPEAFSFIVTQPLMSQNITQLLNSANVHCCADYILYYM